MIGLGLDEARKTAFGSGFQLEITYEKGSEPNPKAQQSSPPDLRVINQTPEPKTLAPSKSTIKVTVRRRVSQPSKANRLLDTLVPTVYAAAPEKRPPRACGARKCDTAAESCSLT